MLPHDALYHYGVKGMKWHTKGVDPVKAEQQIAELGGDLETLSIEELNDKAYTTDAYSELLNLNPKMMERIVSKEAYAKFQASYDKRLGMEIVRAFTEKPIPDSRIQRAKQTRFYKNKEGKAKPRITQHILN